MSNKDEAILNEIKEIAEKLTPEDREKMIAKIKERYALHEQKPNETTLDSPIYFGGKSEKDPKEIKLGKIKF